MELVMDVFCIVAWGILQQVAVTQGQTDHQWDRCSSDAIMASMSACQASRHVLSLASQTNDTVKLCGALQRYSNCMSPRLEGCKGATRMAFDVIKAKYASHYNCQILLASHNRFQDPSPSYVNPYRNNHEHRQHAFNPRDRTRFHNNNEETTRISHNFQDTTPFNESLSSMSTTIGIANTTNNNDTSTTHVQEKYNWTSVDQDRTESTTVKKNSTQNVTVTHNPMLKDRFDPADNSNGAANFFTTSTISHAASFTITIFLFKLN